MMALVRILGGRRVALAAAVSMAALACTGVSGAGVSAAAVATPTGQWLATSVTTSLTGDVANDHVGNTVVRGWDFARVCSKSVCHTDLVRTEYAGAIGHGTLVANAAGFQVETAPEAATCAIEPGQPVRRETISVAFSIEWVGRTELRGTDTDTITGCANPTPSVVTTSVTAVRVPPAPAPPLEVSHRHAGSHRAFVRRARTICRALNVQELPIATAMKAAAGLARTATSHAVKARAEAELARLIPRLPPLLAREYDEIPQPPVGPLDLVWLREVDAARALLAPETAAFAALAKVASASGDYFRTGSVTDADRAAAEALFFTEDLAHLVKVATTLGTVDAQRLRLPAICVSPPALKSVFSSGPTV